MPLLKKIGFAISTIRKRAALTLSLFFQRPSPSVLLCISSPASVGGTEFFLNQIGEQETESNEKVLVLIIGKINSSHSNLFLERLRQKKIDYLSFGKTIPSKKSLFFLFKRLGASRAYFFNPLSSLLMEAAKQAGMKLFYIETGMPDKNDPWWHPLFPHIVYLDQVIGVSQESLNRFQSMFNYRGAHRVYYPLIDPPPSFLTKREPSSSSFFHIVYFGRIYRDKGVEQLLTAFRKLLHRCPSAHLTYIGEGKDLLFLQEQTLNWNIERSVHFRGFEKKERLWELLYSFDLFSLPSISEGAPCAILEAMAVGLPIVATRVGGIPELIENGVSGILIKPNNSEALYEALLLCAENPSFRKKLGIEGKKRYETYFSKQGKLAEKMLK